MVLGFLEGQNNPVKSTRKGVIVKILLSVPVLISTDENCAITDKSDNQFTLRT